MATGSSKSEKVIVESLQKTESAYLNDEPVLFVEREESMKRVSPPEKWKQEEVVPVEEPASIREQLVEQVAKEALDNESSISDGDARAVRPSSLEASKPKKKIKPQVNVFNDEEDDGSVHSNDLLDDIDDIQTPEDLDTPDEVELSDLGELELDDDTSVETPDVIPEYTAEEEMKDFKSWKSVTIGDKQYRIDMKVIEPYKKVLSHGGYISGGLNAIIVFSGCFLPDRSRKDYHYVMDNLFLYVTSTLEQLVAEDYIIVYFHGATPKRQMPSFSWLKRCYQMIDRRLKKTLKSLMLVHPTLWLKTIVMMTRPFISSKFYSKLTYIKTLEELSVLVPMEYIFVPEQVKLYDEHYCSRHSNSTPSTPSSPSYLAPR